MLAGRREKERAALCFTADLDLLQAIGPGEEKEEAKEETAPRLFPDPEAKYDFSALLKNQRTIPRTGSAGSCGGRPGRAESATTPLRPCAGGS